MRIEQTGKFMRERLQAGNNVDIGVTVLFADFFKNGFVFFFI